MSTPADHAGDPADDRAGDRAGDPAADVELREATRADEAEVLALLGLGLPGWRGADAVERWRWKHEDSPFGPSRVVIAVEPDGTLVGVCAAMRWQLVLDGERLSAGRSTDFVVHPDRQRAGIGKRIVQQEYTSPQWPGQDIQFVHGNDRSAGNRTKAGLPDSQHPQVHLAPTRPWRWAAWKLRGGTRASGHEVFAQVSDVLDANEAAVEDLLARAQPAGRLVTDRSLAYLRWRYERCPNRRYLAVPLPGSDGRLRGLLIGRHVRPDDDRHLDAFEVSELIVPEDDRAAMWSLLRRVWKVPAAYAEVLLPLPPRSRFEPLRAGFSPPRESGRTFSGQSWTEDLSDVGRWVLPLGDLEAF